MSMQGLDDVFASSCAKRWKGLGEEKQAKIKKGLIITAIVVGALAALGAAYALTGHFVGFGTMNQAIVHGLGTAAAAVKHFYTHLNVWKGVVGIGLPTVAVALLTTAAALKIIQCRKAHKQEEQPKVVLQAEIDTVSGSGTRADPYIIKSEPENYDTTITFDNGQTWFKINGAFYKLERPETE